MRTDTRRERWTAEGFITLLETDEVGKSCNDVVVVSGV
jgi:hypothetical protein